MEKFNKEYLSGLGVYELRSIARSVGVKSPTTKKHEELVNAILKIQNGEEKAVISNKGRPPKTITLGQQSMNTQTFEKKEGVPTTFKYAKDFDNGYGFCDDEVIQGINITTFICNGIVREVENKKYIFNYSGCRKYISIDDTLLNEVELNVGDFVIGKAYPVGDFSGKLISVTDLNFKNVQTGSMQTQQIRKIQRVNKTEEVYSEIDKDLNELKIMVELEVPEYTIMQMQDKCIFLASEERDDIRRSYNAMLDCKNVIKRLSMLNKKFSLKLIDIDYIFTIINAYNISIGLRDEVDAGQFVKEILLDIKNCEGANLICYELSSYKRNDLLDAILNKYV